MALRLRTLHGREILDWLDAITQLRITIFYHYPYLYQGTLDYERDYLAKYAQSPTSFCALALAGEQVVGCSTAIALTAADAEFQAPFIERAIDLAQVFYFGESLLDARYRGTGIGKQFFALREARAAQLNLPVTAFCAVQRPAAHPLKPASYQPLDDFWRAQGYQAVPGMQANYHWLDRDQTQESAKPMQFWLKGYPL